MAEYIEREEVRKAVVEAVDGGLATTAEDLAEVIEDIPEREVAPVEEVAVLEAKNEVLGRENDRLKAEIKRLHEENFWLMGGLGHEEG